MKCRNCGKEVKENWKKCPWCKASLVEVTLKCPNCGEEVEKSWDFCPACEYPLHVLNDNNDQDILPNLDDSDLVATVVEEAKNAEYQKKLEYARVACIRKKYDEAQQIYDNLIKENPLDSNAYIGYIRIASKNFTIFEGEEVEESIRIAKQISKEDLSKFDADYADYLKSRKHYLEEKSRKEAERNKIEKKRKEAERKLKEEAAKKAKEIEAAKPRREGKYIYFGMWPQSAKSAKVTISKGCDENDYYSGSDGNKYAKVNNKYFKVESLKWRILKERKGTILLLSDSIIEAKAFARFGNDYANSEIRRWMNEDFYTKAFTKLERTFIQQMTVDNSEDSTGFDSNEFVCEDTYDNIFLLSYREAMDMYNLKDEDRQIKPTAYALANDAWINDKNRCGAWWLRSPDSDFDTDVCIILADGSEDCGNSSDESMGVVLALQICL